MRATSYYISILFIFLGFSTIAQQYNFQKYSIEDGLPRSAVYSLCEDKDGFLWIGLDGGGVSMFDGKSFKNFDISDGLPSHKVRAVFQDSRGNMWFGTSDGLCKYDFDTITVYTTKNGLCDNYIRTIEEDNDGNIWIGTNNGLSIFNGKQFANYNIHDGLLDYKIRVITKDHTGKMLVGTDSGINFFNGTYFEDVLYNYYLPHPTVLEIFEDSKNFLWIGTKAGVLKIKEDDRTVYTSENGVVADRVRAIAEDQYHNIWLGTRSGISKFDGYNFTTFNQTNGLSHDRIRDIMLDSRDNLWFATYFGGIDRYSGNDIISFTTSEGIISNQVFSIFEDSKYDIILGTFDGISKMKFENGEIKEIININSDNGLSDNRVQAVIKDEREQYWYGTQDGITITLNDKIYQINKENGLVDNQVTSIFHSEPNVYWIGTESGISKITFYKYPTGYTIKNFSSKTSANLAGKEVSTIFKDDFGNLWFGFRNGGVTILDKNERIIQPNLPEKIINITSIVKGKNDDTWIGTDANGLFNIKNTNNFESPLLSVNYNKSDGLSSNHVYAIIKDEYHNIWVGSERGLDNLLFNQDNLLERITHYGTKDGLKGIEINENAAYKDHNNNLWFGTVEGVSFLDASLLKTKQTPPKVFITEIKIFGSKINKENSYGLPVQGRFQLPKELVLPYNKNSIQFEITPVDLRYSEKTQLKWKLDGFDKDWQLPTTRRNANYTNLPAGSYYFKVLAANEDGEWAETPKVMKVTITPPFWMTKWFITLAVILGIISFSYVSQWRVKRLKKAKLALEQKIEIATKELRKEKEFIEVQNEQIEKQKDQLTEINTSITDSINYAKRIQTAIMKPNAAYSKKIKDKIFIFHRPKDIVSGDFFWLRDFQGASYITAADCTGHGVPGAFMSMIGITYLNQIIDTSSSQPLPHDMLSELRSNVINALKHEGSEKTKDGMDMSLCRIDWEENKVYYAGAYNSLYHVRGGVLTEIKANSMPIGDHDHKDQPFDLHELQIQKGDMLYLFSDGYADQFGGPKGKKYKYKPFKFFLESIYDHPLEKQRDALENEHDRWIGDYEQIDDIIVIGIKI